MPPSLTHTPGVNEAQPGVFKYSSGVVRVVDLRKRFGVEKDQWQKPGRIVIAEVMGGHAGFWVDEIIDVVQMPMTGWNSLPAQLPRDVFSKTLLMNEVIHLYAEFERLDAFKETGYLRRHIEMLLEQVTKNPILPTSKNISAGVSGRHNEVNTSTSSAEARSDHSRSVTQAAKADSAEIKKTPLSAQPPVVSPAVSDTRTEFKANTGSAGLSRPTEPLSAKRQLPGPGQGLHSERSTVDIKAHDSAPRLPAGAHMAKDDRIASDLRSESSVPQTVPRDAVSMPGKQTHSQVAQVESHRQYHASTSGEGQQREKATTDLLLSSPATSEQLGRVQSTLEKESNHGGLYLLLLMLLVLIAIVWYGVTEWQQASVSDTAAESVEIPNMSASPAQFESTEVVDSSLPVYSYNSGQADEEPIPEPLDDNTQLSKDDEVAAAEIEYRADIGRDDEGIVIVLSQSAITASKSESIPATDDNVDASVKDEVETKTEVDIETVVVEIDDKEQQHINNVAEVDAVEASRVETGMVEVKQSSQPLADPGSDVVGNERKSVAEMTGSTRVIVHVVVKGDTLWHIAKRYVKNPYLYPELARLSRIKNPDLIYPGDRVKIILKK